jgi:uncharacterized RmlC-like cupin family protein
MASSNPTQAKDGSNTAIQGAFDVANSTVYKITPAAATDPFSGKSNKYAECKAVMVVSTGAACHVAFGDTAPTADTSDFFIPANVPTVIYIDSNKPYMSVIQAAATATVYVTELA